MKPTFETSHETMALVDYFRQAPIGTPVSFETLSRGVNFKVTSSLSAYTSARRIAERDHAIVIEAIRGFGFVRINGAEIVKSADRFFQKIRRGSRREASKQEIAVMSNLSRDEMLKATENLSRLRILETTSMSTRRAASNRPTVEEPPTIKGR